MSSNNRHEFSGCGDDDYCIEAAFGEPHCGQPREAEIHDTRPVFLTAQTGPCSACGDGDTALKYHSHGEPIVQPEVAPPPERIGAGIVLTVEQCAAQFEGYAKGNPFPDRAHAYQHCADYLRENCRPLSKVIRLIEQKRDEWQRLKDREVKLSPDRPTTDYIMFRDQIIAANELISLLKEKL